MPTLPYLNVSLGLASIVAALLGVMAGRLARRWAVQLTPLENESSRRGSPWVELATATLFAGLVAAMVGLECQQTPTVRPSALWQLGRIGSHLILVTLLVTSTVTDLRDYVVPDAITLPGLLIGIGLATLSGQMQIVHVWVDWNQEVPGLAGPFIPEWLDAHRHLHGLVWSLAGAIVGGGLVWLVRTVASLAIGREAMGFGDVTLMAMVGSFLGWQPVVCALLIAPLAGALFALLLRLLTGRTFVPFGPYLALGSLVVLFAWRWIWMFEWTRDGRRIVSVRLLFGDALGLVVLVGIAFTALVGLCLLLRLYRAIPVRAVRRGDDC